MGNVIILPEIPSIIAEAKRLKNEGVNILIALGHSGFEMDIEIAKQVEDIDLVVGGHSNTFLYTGNSNFDTFILSYEGMNPEIVYGGRIPLSDFVSTYMSELMFI